MKHLGTLRFCILFLLAVSCGKSKSTDSGGNAAPAITNEPRPAVAAEPAAQPSASAAPMQAEKPLPKGPRFRRVYRASSRETVELLDPPALAFYNPRTADDTTIVVLSDSGVASYPIEPEKRIKEKTESLNGEPLSLIDYTLDVGGSPSALCVHATWALRYEDPEEHEYKRTGGVYLQWNGKSFDFKRCEPTHGKPRARSQSRPPRELDDALLAAPIRNAQDRLVWGSSAPPMLVADKSLYLWKGKRWSAKKNAEWTYREETREIDSTRLDNGQTFILNGGYLVDSEGEIQPVVLLDEEGKLVEATAERGLWLDTIPVLVTKNREFFMPEERPFFKPADVPKRETKPAAEASTASADSGFAAPSEFTPSCTTPFVLLASPKDARPRYAALLDGIYAKGYGFLQDEVTFIEYRSGGTLYFGAQAKSEKMADKLIKAIEKNVSAVKPRLQCADILTKIPDRYAPPNGARIIGINLSTGDTVDFD